MAINVAYLEVRLSGGAANTDINLSFGGAMSSTKVVSKTITGAPTGVTILDAPGSAAGTGVVTITGTGAGQTVQWTPSGSTIGTAVTTGAADQRYIIKDSSGLQTLLISTVNASMSAGTTNVTVAQAVNKIFPDVTKAQVITGVTQYRLVYLWNAHSAEDILQLQHYISSQPTGGDSISIGVDPAPASATPNITAPADQFTAPSGVTFSAPSTLGAALSNAALTHGTGVGLWIKRVVPTGIVATTTADLSTVVNYIAY